MIKKSSGCRYFDYSEFDSPDVPGSGKGMAPVFLQMLDNARYLAGIPFIINSGFRSNKHNALVGGVRNSAHTRGYAADIACDNDRQRYKILGGLIKAGFTRIGIHRSFIHVDCDPGKDSDVTWLYL